MYGPFTQCMRELGYVVGDILLSTQVLQEFYVAVTRKLARQLPTMKMLLLLLLAAAAPALAEERARPVEGMSDEQRADYRKLMHMKGMRLPELPISLMLSEDRPVR